MEERNNLAADRFLMAEHERTLRVWPSRFRIACPDQRTAGHRPSAKLSGDCGFGGSKAQIDVPLQVKRRLGHELSPELNQSTNDGFGSQSFSQYQRGEGMQSHFKFRDHAEVAASAAQGPEEVRILFCVGAHNGAVGSDQRQLLNVIAGEAEAPREPSRASAQD